MILISINSHVTRVEFVMHPASETPKHTVHRSVTNVNKCRDIKATDVNK
jgi:hypothetical protein